MALATNDFDEIKNIDLTEWIESNTKHTGSRTAPDSVTISFSKISRNKKGISVVIKLGTEVMDHLEWKINDKITVLNHKDDMLKFMLVKRNKGIKIKKYNRSETGFIRMVWKNSFPLIITPAHTVNYQIHKSGYLIFRARMDQTQ
jgi:hypothetical protein